VLIGFFTLSWLVGRFVRERSRRADAFASGPRSRTSD
jgi:hypothetical protein